jgi:hypothetical protein
MNYKAGAQAGASRCQRHHPARTFRLVKFILGLMMKMSRAIVNLMGGSLDLSATPEDDATDSNA